MIRNSFIFNFNEPRTLFTFLRRYRSFISRVGFDYKNSSEIDKIDFVFVLLRFFNDFVDIEGVELSEIVRLYFESDKEPGGSVARRSSFFDKVEGYLLTQFESSGSIWARKISFFVRDAGFFLYSSVELCVSLESIGRLSIAYESRNRWVEGSSSVMRLAKSFSSVRFSETILSSCESSAPVSDVLDGIDACIKDYRNLRRRIALSFRNSSGESTPSDVIEKLPKSFGSNSTSSFFLNSISPIIDAYRSEVGIRDEAELKSLAEGGDDVVLDKEDDEGDLVNSEGEGVGEDSENVVDLVEDGSSG